MRRSPHIYLADIGKGTPQRRWRQDYAHPTVYCLPHVRQDVGFVPKVWQEIEAWEEQETTTRRVTRRMGLIMLREYFDSFNPDRWPNECVLCRTNKKGKGK